MRSRTLRHFRCVRHGQRAVPLVGALAAGVLFSALIGIGAPGQRAATQSLSLRVVDGDTVIVAATGERIRILDVDAPESGDRARCAAERAAARRAAQALRETLRHGSAQVQRSGAIDRYGRTLARLSVDGIDVSSTLLAQGVVRPWRGRREPWCGRNGELTP